MKVTATALWGTIILVLLLACTGLGASAGDNTDHRAAHPPGYSDYSSSEVELMMAVEPLSAIADIIGKDDTTRLGSGIGLAVDFVRQPVQTGQLLTKAQTATAPSIEVTAGDGQYVVLMVDPDAPDPQNPIRREWLHWMLVDVPGRQVVRPVGGLGMGQEVMPYAGPTPPIGVHRYIFLAYRQPGGPGSMLSDEERQDIVHKGRAKFSHADFAAAHNLGAPVAANFFRCAAGS